MLRGTATPEPAQEMKTETETYQPRAERGEPGRTVLPSREPILSLDEPHEVASPPKLPIRLTLAEEDSFSSLRVPHQRQQSVPTYANSRPRTPTRVHSRHQSQGMPLTGDGQNRRRADNSPGRFAGWLGGTSPSVDVHSPDTTPKSIRSTATVDQTPKSATQSRFGFLASSMSAITTRLTSPTPTANHQVDDELCNMDIEAALYPAISPSDRDTFSPAAYKNLQANALGLLHKMQEACQQRTSVLHEVQAEREAQKEEIEEAELRARHYKNQLENMAAKAAEQETAMQQLMAELQAEKRARYEERIAHEKLLGDGSTVTEDLCVDEEERKRWRKSGGTVRSDLSVDTDGDSAESASIFSRSRSPTIMTSATECETPEVQTPITPMHPKSLAVNAPRQRTSQQLTTFQKLMKGISGEPGKKEDGGLAGSGVCGNCRGQDSSVAWDTVSLLRDENKGLKQRVAHLEVVVDGALDIVNGIGL
ncbi:hypothetical protein F5B20DRAFT_11636 [Whalleya microplaca]|nr:hypothetical protein F5B20DRAFT_11636 [Whalleya microplaca]